MAYAGLLYGQDQLCSRMVQPEHGTRQRTDSGDTVYCCAQCSVMIEGECCMWQDEWFCSDGCKCAAARGEPPMRRIFRRRSLSPDTSDDEKAPDMDDASTAAPLTDEFSHSDASPRGEAMSQSSSSKEEPESPELAPTRAQRVFDKVKAAVAKPRAHAETFLAKVHGALPCVTWSMGGSDLDLHAREPTEIFVPNMVDLYLVGTCGSGSDVFGNWA
jgi:hypothetical protein